MTTSRFPRGVDLPVDYVLECLEGHSQMTETQMAELCNVGVEKIRGFLTKHPYLFIDSRLDGGDHCSYDLAPQPDSDRGILLLWGHGWGVRDCVRVSHSPSLQLFMLSGEGATFNATFVDSTEMSSLRAK